MKKSYTKNIFVLLLTVLPAVVFAQSSTTCDVIMNAGPVNRATGYGEEEILDANYQAVCQRYNNLTGTIRKINFQARMNPLASTSNTIRVRVYNENGSTGLPGVILGQVDVSCPSSATLVAISADLSLGTGVVVLPGSTNVFITLELFSQSIDDFFVQRNNPPDGQALNLNLIKQGGIWYKDLTTFGPQYDFDFMFLPIKTSTVTSNFSSLPVGAMVTFTNTSSGASHYYWDFGDGNSSGLTSPVHSYTNNNTYNVKLIAWNIDSSCVDSVVHPVIVVTGINESSPVSESSIKLLSSPIADNELLLETPFNATLSIYDMLGSLKGTYLVSKNKVFYLNISQFNSGIYIIKSDHLQPLRFIKK